MWMSVCTCDIDMLDNKGDRIYSMYIGYNKWMQNTCSRKKHSKQLLFDNNCCGWLRREVCQSGLQMLLYWGYLMESKCEMSPASDKPIVLRLLTIPEQNRKRAASRKTWMKKSLISGSDGTRPSRNVHVFVSFYNMNTKETGWNSHDDIIQSDFIESENVPCDSLICIDYRCSWRVWESVGCIECFFSAQF